MRRTSNYRQKRLSLWAFLLFAFPVSNGGEHEALTQPPAALAGDLGDFRSPLLFSDGTKVENASQWPKRRAEILATWTNLLGNWPDIITVPEVEILRTEQREGFVQHTVR
ncbi:MAG: hypothetical protein AAGC68_10860, partial [Verrucomicrobiota bacterium]